MIFHVLNSAIRKILCFSCPKCGTCLFPITLNLKQWRLGLIRCSNCGANLKLSNGLFIATLYGLFCGALIVSTRYWGFGSEWGRVGVVVAICWFVVWPIFCRLLGHWQTAPDSSELKKPSSENRRWSRYASLSFWLSCASIISISIMCWFVTMKIKHLSSKVGEGSELASTQLFDNTFSFLQAAMVASLLGIIFGLVFFVIGVVCHIKAKKHDCNQL